MIENALPSRLVLPSRSEPRSAHGPYGFGALVVVMAIGAGPTPAQASPREHKSEGFAVADEDGALSLDQQRRDLEGEALALVQQERFLEASAAWERLAAHESETEARVIAEVHAADAWLMAFEVSGDPGHHCAAERILARILEEEVALDERARQDFTKMLDDSRSSGIDCSTHKSSAELSRRTVPLLMGTAQRSRPSPRRATPSTEADMLRGSSARTNASTISGAVSLSLAGPLLGGLLYALLDDLRVSKELRAYTARVKAGEGLSDAGILHAEQLGDRALRNRSLALGLGLSGAALTGLGIGLLIRGKRRSARGGDAQLSIHPQTSPRSTGVALLGRF